MRSASVQEKVTVHQRLKFSGANVRPNCVPASTSRTGSICREWHYIWDETIFFTSSVVRPSHWMSNSITCNFYFVVISYPLPMLLNMTAHLLFTSCSSTSTSKLLNFLCLESRAPSLDFHLGILDFSLIFSFQFVCAHGPAVSCPFMGIGGVFTYAN